MPGLYTITPRATGTIITQAIYDADHQNHIDHLEPGFMDDYSANLATQRAQTSPATLPTTLAGELERLRYVLAKLGNQATWDLVLGPRPSDVYWRVTGAAATGVKQAHALLGLKGVIKEVKVYSEVAPLTTDLIIDVNLNGTSIWAATQANRAKVLAGANAGAQTVFDTSAVLAEDRLSLDVDQVGTGTTGGNDLLVVIVLGAPTT